jgi:hypothetical protein
MGIAYMEQERNTYRVLVGRSGETGSLEISMHRWEGLCWVHPDK